MKRTLPAFSRHIILLAILFSFGFCLNLQAQNCTVNANIDLPLCANQPLNLNGSASGLFSTTAKWSQVAGPSVTIVTPNSLTSSVTGFVAGNAYTFRLSAKCADGSLISDDVVYTIKPITVATAGADVAGCPGTFALAANAAGSGETGQWTIVGGNNAGVLIATPASSTTSITLPTTSAGTTILRWTITNSNSCSSQDDISVSNSGGVTPIDAGPNQGLGTCYSTTQSTTLAASLGGNISTQRGTWSLVSGPSNPSFGDIHSNTSSIGNLVQGTYVLQWTVVGPCASGSDQMTITVAAATQSVTTASVTSVTYCNGTTEALLVGNVPTYSNETVSWIQTQGPTATTVITNSSSPSTAITGLDGNSNYTFRYTITGPNGCNSGADGTVRYFAASTINVDADNSLPGVQKSRILACGVNSVTLPFTTSGGSATNARIISGPFTTANTGIGGSPYVLNGLNAAGTYVIRFTRSSNGITCSNAFDDVSVTVSASPSASNAGTPQILGCNIHTTNLAGNAPISGVGFWTQVSGPNNAVIADHYNKDTQISSLIEGVYVFKWTISLGPQCPVEESITSVRVSPPTPTTSIAGPDLAACANSPFIMTGNPVGAGEVGLWTVSPNAGITFSDATSHNATVTGFAANTTYHFTWTITNTCGFDASGMDVTTGPTSGASIADAGVNICLSAGNASSTLAAVVPTAGIGTWSVLSGPNVPSFVDANNPSTTINGLTDGTYELKWEVALAGCQSNFDTMLLTVSNPPVTADAGASSITVCGTSTNLTGNAVAPSIGTWTLKSGPASVVIANPTSATSLITFVDAGVYTFTWSVNASACQSGVNADDVIVYVSLPATTAMITTAATIDVCSNNQVTLGANTPASGETGIWSVVGNSPNTPTFTNLSSPTTSVTGLITGSYTFRWTISGGIFCTPTFSDVVVNVSTAVYAGADQNLCNQTQTTLTGNPGSTGIWTQSGGDPDPVLTSTGPYSVLVSNLDPNKTYTFKYTANAVFSCASAFDEVDVIGYPAPTVPDAGIDQEKCTSAIGASVSATLTGNVPVVGIGSWSLVSGPTSPAIGGTNPVTVTGLKEGIYVFKWSITNGGCTTYFDIMRVSVFDPPTISNAGTIQPNACQLTVTLNGNVPVKGIGRWSQVSGPNTAVIDFPNQPQSTLSGLAVGTYKFKWTISNGIVCTPSESDVDVTFTGAVPTTPAAGLDQNLCNVTGTTLDGNTITTGTGVWSVSGPNTPAFTASLNNTGVTGMIPGVYTFTWTVNNGGCTLTDDVVVTIYASPSAAVAGNDQEICPFDPVALAAAAISSGTGLWSFVSGPSTPVIANPSSPTTAVNGTIPGTYVFEWKVTNGICTPNVDQVTIVVKSNCAPVVTVDAHSTLEDNVLTVSAANGILNNDTDPEGQTLTVTTTPVVNPSHGSVVVQSDGSFVYTPTADYNGSDSFTVSVCDNGSPIACANNVVNITVTPVNDEPSFVKGSDEVKNMNAPAQSVTSWATSISKGPADESTQTLSFALTNDNNALFDVQPAISATGTLTYKPKANTSGLATVTVILTDNGGTANGGDDTFATQTFTITISPNDPPVAADHTNVAMSSSASATAIDALTATDVDGTVDSYTIISLPSHGTLALNGTAVTINQVLTPAEAALLTYDPDGDVNSDDTFTFTATDDIGMSDLTPAAVTIPLLNTPPVAADHTNPALSSSAGATAIDALTASDPDGTIASYTIVSLPSHGSLALGGTLVTVNQVLTPAEAITLTYDPDGDFKGDDTFTFTATDNSGDDDLSPATVTIPLLNTPPVADDHTNTGISSSAPATAIDALTASDPDGTVVSYLIITLPAHGTLALGGTPVTVNQVLTPAEVLVLTYDPAGDFNGDDTFTFTATDDSGDDDLTPVTVTIPVLNTPPVAVDHTNAAISSSANATLLDGLTATDQDGTIDTYTIITLPAHGILALNGTPVTVNQVLTPAEAITLTYDPDANFSGNDTFTFMATDNNGDDDLTPATITIPVLNTPPIADDHTNTGMLSSSGATPIDALTATDNDGTIASYKIVTLPAHGTLALNGTALVAGQLITVTQAAALTYDPDGDTNGNDTFTFTAIDNSGEADLTPATVTIPVVNIPPVAVDHSNKVIPSNAGATSIDALIATDADGTIASFTIVTLPAHGTLGISGVPVVAGQVITPAQADALTYDPDGTFNGDDHFTFTATDNNGGVDASPATITIPVNAPPVAVNDSSTTKEDTPVTITILSNDTDDLGVIASTIDLNPSSPGIQFTITTAEGTWTVNASGVVTFVPVHNYNGTAAITYTVNDASGEASNVATITVTIEPVNDPPVGVDKVHQTVVGVPVSGVVFTDATDPENTTLTVNTTPVKSPANGTITINADGTYAYTPNPGFAGTDQIEVQICDSGLPLPSLCTTLLITINIGVESGSEVIVPEGFSPNGDGINDFFVIQNHTGSSLRLQVFNRWGNLVYRNDNYQNDWNGYANHGVTLGDGLPDGTYYYVVENDSFKEVRFMTIHR